jgi:competence protein ComEA
VRAGARIVVIGMIAIAGMALSVSLALGVQLNATQQFARMTATKADTKVQPAPAERVDINRASMNELMKIPGMKQTWAARIVRFRPYRTKVDLLDGGVLPSDVYDQIKDYVIAHRE